MLLVVDNGVSMKNVERKDCACPEGSTTTTEEGSRKIRLSEQGKSCGMMSERWGRIAREREKCD